MKKKLIKLCAVVLLVSTMFTGGDNDDTIQDCVVANYEGTAGRSNLMKSIIETLNRPADAFRKGNRTSKLGEFHLHRM